MSTMRNPGRNCGSRPVSPTDWRLRYAARALGDSHLRGPGPVAPEQRIPHDEWWLPIPSRPHRE
jgi:hypothetical protein